MTNFTHYMEAQANKEAAGHLYNYASQKLENAQIKERLAEIKSQHEPIASLLEEPMSERGRLYAIAFYVVVGRMPDHGHAEVNYDH
ncbi:MAG: hypothetical protein U9Q84_01475 [Thermodesulfobacteriota bacterium]|nr:hypothetical protein [Thermodesulfobacteriota bacterium]